MSFVDLLTVDLLTVCLFLNMVDSFYALFFNTYLPIRI